MTYLQLVNSVLVRLRESQVTSVTDTAYSTMIGQLVNDSKRQVEDSFNWDALSLSITGVTSPGVHNYTITGSGIRQKDVVCNDITNKARLRDMPVQWIIDQYDLTTPASGNPIFYAWNGNDGVDSKVEFYPTPNGVYTIRFHMYASQASLTANGDTLLVPSEPVILGAYARALVERGEDGGLASSEAYGLFKSSIADHIALESAKYPENDTWEAV